VTDGLPPLPTIGIALEFADPRPSSPAALLGRHIRAALPGLGPEFGPGLGSGLGSKPGSAGPAPGTD
jgi:hypothetical protein